LHEGEVAVVALAVAEAVRRGRAVFRGEAVASIEAASRVLARNVPPVASIEGA
jgi:hypothetical protein